MWGSLALLDYNKALKAALPKEKQLIDDLFYYNTSVETNLGSFARLILPIIIAKQGENE